MKKVVSLILFVLLSGCKNEIKSNLLKSTAGKQEQLQVDVFSLAFHKQFGNCDSRPITHRMISFNPIYLAKNGNDTFIGSLDVLLDESTSVYKMQYREFPGLENPDQTIYEDLLTGTFQLIKAQDASSNDSVILDNIGTITPTINGSVIGFVLKLDQDLHKVLMSSEIKGRVTYSSTPFITDNCLL